jgi:hypothetical protein
MTEKTSEAPTTDEIRSAVLNAKAAPRRTQLVHVPEWGLDLRVQALTRREAAQLQGKMVNTEGELVPREIKIADQRIFAATVVDDRGNLLFSDNDVEALGNSDSAAINFVAGVARRLSGMIEGETRARIEAIMGNSAPRPVSAG